MPATLKELGIDQWSVADRRKLLHDLHDSLPEDDEPVACSMSAEEMQFIDARLACAAADPEGGNPWRKVMDRVFGKR